MDFLSKIQLRILGWSVVGIALLVLGGTFYLVSYSLLILMRELQEIIFPLGGAALLAYIAHPAVVFLQKKIKLSRTSAVLVLMGAAFSLLLGIGFWIVPKLYQESVRFSLDLPDRVSLWQQKLEKSAVDHPVIDQEIKEFIGGIQSHWPEWSQKFLGSFWNALKGFGSTTSLILGFLFIPLYVFYLLRDQASIESNWKRYIPLHPSAWKEELVFVLGEVNRYLIVFFRGQILVALSLGVLTSLGLLLIGIPYALLIGMMTGVLSIVPYLGVVVGLTGAGLVAFIQPGGGWGLVIGVGIVFSVVQLLEGFLISPRIMGNRTGLHPMTIILSILIWSHLLGGIVGALLAIPLTATLKVLMFRYFWKD